MLNVQNYLSSGKTIADLETELAIKSAYHPTEPLVILNYNQIESPKTDKIVRECRGLTLEINSWNVVAKSFPRFFNWGEVQDEMDLFDFSDFHTLSKEDGSLCLIYNYKGNWYANTRGSFGIDEINFSGITWNQGFCKALGVNSLNDLKLDPSLTHVAEFCSPWNKVVRRYPDPKMYLLSAFDGLNELHIDDVDKLVSNYFHRPMRYNFYSISEIQKFLQVTSEADATFEGVVICDKNGLRYKVKNPTYLALHSLKGEGNNLFHPKYLVPFILNGESSELLTYFPEATSKFNEYSEIVNNAYSVLEKTWEENWQIKEQKDFALSIVPKTKFSGILFSLRRLHGMNQSKELLKETWRNSFDAIMKILFDKQSRELWVARQKAIASEEVIEMGGF